MATIVPISIRFDAEIIQALDEVSELTQISRSDFVRQAVAEKLEDMFDIAMADKAYQTWLDSGKKNLFL